MVHVGHIPTNGVLQSSPMLCHNRTFLYLPKHKIIVYNEGKKWHGWTVLLTGITGWVRVSMMIWRSLVFITTECVLFKKTIYTRKCQEVVFLQAKLSILCPVELNGWDLSSALSSCWNERNVILPELSPFVCIKQCLVFAVVGFIYLSLRTQQYCCAQSDCLKSAIEAQITVIL